MNIEVTLTNIGTNGDNPIRLKAVKTAGRTTSIRLIQVMPTETDREIAEVRASDLETALRALTA